MYGYTNHCRDVGCGVSIYNGTMDGSASAEVALASLIRIWAEEVL